MANEDPVPDADAFQPPLHEMTHRGRVVRVGVALAMTGLGLITPAPYAGYAGNVVLFAPALLLELSVARSLRAGQRKVVGVLSAPTVLGLVFGFASWLELMLRPGAGCFAVLKLAVAGACSTLVAWLASELALVLVRA